MVLYKKYEYLKIKDMHLLGKRDPVHGRHLLMLSMLGKSFSRRQFKIVFLFFPENRFWHFMQIVVS